MSDPHIRPARIAPAEWEARVQLAAAYRVFDLMGWSELIFNHISLRVPGEDAHFLINPFGLHYSEVRASNLVKVDVRGQVVGASDWPINPAGFTFHGAIHEHLPHAHCVMHIHTTATMALCCVEGGSSSPTSTPRSCTVAWPTTTSRASRCTSTREGASWPAPQASRCCCCATTAP